MAKLDFSQDLKELSLLLITHKVKFLLIGGYAVSAYSEPRCTKDIDFWVCSSKDNINLLEGALKEFGFCFANLELLCSKENKMIILGNAPNRCDILNYCKGLSFDKSFASRNVLKPSFLDFELPIISKEDLIINKQAVGRPQDLVDVITLLKT